MKRYITNGVHEQIPLDLQLFCWQCYERVKVAGEYDYLQVFELKQIGEYIQQIEHRQEVPEYRQAYQLKVNDTINQKIFIIEEEEYVTMLLGEEY